MVTYFTNSNNQRDNSMVYSRENLSAPYPESQFLQSDNPMMYLHPPTSAGTSNCIGGFEASDSASMHQNQVLCSLGNSSRIQEVQDFGSWRENGTRNVILLMNPMTSPASILQTGQGLSLSLGSQVFPGIHQMNQSISFQNNPNLRGSGDEHTRDNELAQPGFSGGNRTICSSKYLKAAQELLDEVVNVKKGLRQFQPDCDKNRENDGQNTDPNDGADPNNGLNQQEMSHMDRQELQSKLTKLMSMLDEVDRRYKQYSNQMQIVVSSFDVISGFGSAKPYTTLALQTISRHFRNLQDAISSQVLATRKSLGEQDSSDNTNVGITRLRYVDQQLIQQKALQQLGITHQHHHGWRPQRGLPENSVSVLRAWLFEHFLHPYPTDSDKMMLARQTGLTRVQVSNWFINARVRLWKPMVEEIYNDEFAGVEVNSDSSENLAAETPKRYAARRETLSTGLNGSQQSETDYDHTVPDMDQEPNPVILQNDHTRIIDPRFVVAAAARPYHMATETGGQSNVSLTLGLQGGAADLPALPGGNRFSSLYQNTSEPTAFEYVEPDNRQDRFSSSIVT